MLDVYLAKRGVAPHYKLTLDQIYDLSLDAMTDYEIKQIIGGIDETIRDDEDYLDELLSEHDYAIEQKQEIEQELDDIAKRHAALVSEAQQLDEQYAELSSAGKNAWEAAKDVGTAIRETQQITEEYKKAQDYLRDYLRGRK